VRWHPARGRDLGNVPYLPALQQQPPKNAADRQHQAADGCQIGPRSDGLQSDWLGFGVLIGHS